MSDLQERRAEIASARAAHQDQERSLQQERAELKSVQSRLSELSRSGQTDEAAALLETEANLQARIEEGQSTLEGLRSSLYDRITGLVELADPPQLVERLDDSVPFLLMPVRLETRFMRGPEGAHELWVRIFPDDITIETHEEALSPGEVQAGQAYWEAAWRSGDDQAARQGAWRALVNAAGTNRAAWIARVMSPANLEEQPDEPLPPEAELDPAPEFPEPPARQGSWSLPPRARTMPDRFVVMLLAGGEIAHQAVGRPIPEPLIVGPDPAQSESGFQQVNGDLQVDPAMEWMVDFHKAVENGMGLRIPISAAEAAAGFERVLALGLRLSSDEHESQVELERLLDSHHYGSGLSLVPTGTPTNNTTGARAGFSSTQIEAEDSHTVERGDPLFAPVADDFDKRDGQRLAEAFGIRHEVFYHIAHSGRAENREAQAMNRALWAATMGYFMEEMMGPGIGSEERPPVFSLETISRTRAFFTRYVSGRGPLPAFRVGSQPYGVLPTTAFSAFRWSAERLPVGTHAPIADHFLDDLHGVLRQMDAHWGSLAASVSQAGKSADPEREMLDILGLHASAVEFHQRFAAGPDYWQNFAAFRGLFKQSQTFNRLLKEAAAELLGELGFDFPYIPKIFDLTFFRNQTRLGPLVQDGPLSETEPLAPITPAIGNYIHWLANGQDEAQLRDQDFGIDGEGKKIPPPSALLYLLLRHALLQQAWDAVMKVAVGNGLAVFEDRRQVELLNMGAEPGVSRWDYFQAQMPGGPEGLRIGQYLFSGEAAGLDNAAELREVRESLAALADLPTARLERLAAEHLDLCSYRLDAWQLGLVNARLHAMRRRPAVLHDGPAEGQPAEGQGSTGHRLGIYLGAYGWLEDLKPGGARKRMEDGNLPEEFQDPEAPLYNDAANQGHIHAPSLNHAAAAAVLRNAYLTHAAAENAGLMSVNLTSERVRRALWYLDGMRNGQELGALLGYQFERGLHDRNTTLDIDQFIMPIRRKYPLVADHVTPSEPGDPIEALEARNVVDGLKVLKASRQPGYPYGVSELPTSGPIRTAIEAEVAHMADAMDGLSDLALSESVFQAVQGNYERAGAMLKAIAEGGRPYDEPGVVRTPRSGIALTHRVAILFDSADPADSAWPDPLSPRAAFEARLNRWAGDRLGLPGDIRCLARYTDPVTESEQTFEMSMADLALQPLDLLYLTAQDLADEATELEKRLALHVRTHRTLAEDVEIRLAFTERLPAWDAGVKSLFEALPLLNQMRSLVTGSRPAAAHDLKPPADTPGDLDDPHRFDLGELRGRVDTLLGEVDNALLALGAAAGAAALRTALLQAALLGVPDAVPDSAIEATPEAETALVDKAAAVASELTGRRARSQAAITASEAADLKPPQVAERLVEAAQAVLGRSFRVLPLFEAENPAEVQLALEAHAALVAGGPPLAVEEWIDGLGRVRPKLGTYNWMVTLADAIDNPPEPLRALQLPFKVNDRWLAMPLEGGQDTGRETLSLVVQAAAGYRAERQQCGLLVDEFTEVIPGKEETTGLAVHFNQPNAEPPQALLLVVPPVLRGHWQWDDLVAALNETLDLAKKRAVEPDQLGRTAYAQLLPAILMAVTRYPATISLDLAANIKALKNLRDTAGG